MKRFTLLNWLLVCITAASLIGVYIQSDELRRYKDYVGATQGGFDMLIKEVEQSKTDPHDQFRYFSFSEQKPIRDPDWDFVYVEYEFKVKHGAMSLSRKETKGRRATPFYTHKPGVFDELKQYITR